MYDVPGRKQTRCAGSEEHVQHREDCHALPQRKRREKIQRTLQKGSALLLPDLENLRATLLKCFLGAETQFPNVLFGRSAIDRCQRNNNQDLRQVISPVRKRFLFRIALADVDKCSRDSRKGKLIYVFDYRSINQLNIILHSLQDQFPNDNVTIEDDVDDCVEAAMALIHELEVIRDKKSILKIQEAKVITDLLIP